MDVRTYRAATVQEALALVRSELGPQASVLRTREVRAGGLIGWLNGSRLVEVLASASIRVPSRLPSGHRAPASDRRSGAQAAEQPVTTAVRELAGGSIAAGIDLAARLDRLQSRVDDLCRRAAPIQGREFPEALFRLYADLIEAEVSEDLAREMIDELRETAPADQWSDEPRMHHQLARQIERRVKVVGPIRPGGSRRHLVALVGPTGVGKTTTIAKLAANFRLREKRRVGLITVDTYRIAAVEQLRTYADIIDLPMEIVGTPREMHEALARMAELDLILMDTAGRSPRDDVKIQELRAMLGEAAPDEVHLVLSGVASAASLAKTAQQFAAVGTTALVLTKLDEAMSLGNVLPLLHGCGLPLSYMTYGQNVPDDIAAVDARRLAQLVLGLETVHRAVAASC